MKNKELSGVYSIFHTSKPDWIYIGSASKSIKRRWDTHIYQLKKGVHHSQLLQRVVNKYGFDGLVFTVIEVCESHNVILREQFYLDTLITKYNTEKIAQSSLGVKRSDAYKKKLSLAVTGRKQTAETMRKIVESRRNNGRPWHGENWKKAARNKRFNHTDSAKNAIREKLTGRKLPESHIEKFRKPVLQYDRAMNLICLFPSVSHAHNETKVTLSNISLCCLGVRKTAGNFIWKFKN